MFRRVVFISLAVVFAFGILFASVLRSAQTNYAFSAFTSPTPEASAEIKSISEQIDYQLPFPGRILPDHPLWFLKAVRDRMWLFLITDGGKKAELKLLFADKRLSSGKILFERNKPELGYVTLTKAEKYLEEAAMQERANREKGMETKDFLEKLLRASLKHRQVLDEVLLVAPEEAKPGIVKAQDYPKEAYKAARDALWGKGLSVPKSPFDGD